MLFICLLFTITVTLMMICTFIGSWYVHKLASLHILLITLWTYIVCVHACVFTMGQNEQVKLHFSSPPPLLLAPPKCPSNAVCQFTLGSNMREIPPKMYRFCSNYNDSQLACDIKVYRLSLSNEEFAITLAMNPQ